MVRVKGSKVTLTGHREGELKTQLEAWYGNDKSATATTLLDATSANTVDISNTTGKPRTEGGKVLLFWSEKKKNDVHQYDVPELAESCLFELKNLLNMPRFKLAGLGKPLPTYGLEKAKIEAESTVTIVKILKELEVSLNYVPSAWGKRQIEQLGGRTGDVAAQHIASTPHDSSQTNKFRLPSQYLYAYEEMLETMKGMGSTVDIKGMIFSIVEIVSPAPQSKSFSSNYMRFKYIRFFSQPLQNYRVSKQQFFIWLIYAIRDIGRVNGWTVTWKHGLNASDYIKFADAVINVSVVPQILPDTRRVKDIRDGLMNTIKNG